MATLSRATLLLVATYIVVTNSQQCLLNLPCRCIKIRDQPAIDCRRLTSRTLTTLITNPDVKNITFSFIDFSNSRLEEIPGDIFKYLKVKRIVCTKCDSLRTISDSAFAGLENILESLELTIGGGAVVLPPWPAIQVLTKLRVLYLKSFSIPQIDDSEIFTNLTTLSSLRLVKCKIERISHEGTKHLSNLTLFDLSENILPSLQVSALQELQNVEVLDFKQNHISKVPSYAFSANTKLKSIDLSGNKVTELEDRWSRGISKSLERLDMSNNNLAASSLDKISNISSLTALNIEHNKITDDFLPQSLVGLIKLNDLKLGNNHMRKLSRHLFSKMISLRSLDLRHNFIKNIESRSFEFCPNLESLDLSSQTITGNLNISLDAFYGLKLSHLNLYESSLVFPYSWKILKTLVHLTSLDLGQNSITFIPNYVFNYVSNLKILKFGHNLIQNVTQHTFYGLENSLKSIYLHDNRITTINRCVFEKFSLEKMDLNNNPLECGCNLDWIYKWAKDNLGIVFDYLQWKCTDGSLFRVMNSTALNCTGNNSYKCPILHPPTTTTTITTTTTTTVTTTEKPIQVVLKYVSGDYRSITVEWNRNIPNVSHFSLSFKNLLYSRVVYKNVTRNNFSYIITDLKQNSGYQICLKPLFMISRLLQESCIISHTSKIPIKVNLYVRNITKNTAVVSWNINDITYVDYYNITIIHTKSRSYTRIHRGVKSLKLTNLQSDNRYEVRLAVILSKGNVIRSHPVSFGTSSASVTPTSTEHANRATKIAAIVGGVVGSVLLIFIIIIVVFICLRLRRPSDKTNHVYQNTSNVQTSGFFSRTEQPHETYNSRRFKKVQTASNGPGENGFKLRHARRAENDLSHISSGSYPDLCDVAHVSSGHPSNHHIESHI